MYIYLHVYMLCWTWMYFLFTPSSLEFYTHCILLSARLGISRRGCSDRLGRWPSCVSPLSEHLPRVWKTLLCPHLSMRRLLLPLRVWLWRHNCVAPCLLFGGHGLPRTASQVPGMLWPPKDSVCYTEVGSGSWLCEVFLHCSGLLHWWLLLSCCLALCFGKICPEFFLRLTVNRFVDIFCVSSKTVHSSYF